MATCVAQSRAFVAAPKVGRPQGRTSVRVAASSRVDQFSKSDVIVSPSILSANFSKLGEQVRG